jgi:hypothetical protein
MASSRQDHEVNELWNIDLNIPAHPPNKIPLLPFEAFIAENGNFPVSQHITASIFKHMLKQHDLVPTTDALDYSRLQSVIEKSRQPALERLYQQWIKINCDAHLHLRLMVMFVGLDFIRYCIENSSNYEQNNQCIQNILMLIATLPQNNAVTIDVRFIKQLNQTFESIKDLLQEQCPENHSCRDSSGDIIQVLTSILHHRRKLTTLSYFIYTLTQRIEELSQCVDDLKTTEDLFQHCRQPPMPNHAGHGIELGPIRAK